MAKVIPITERFQHFVEELQESFWGDLQGPTRAAWQEIFRTGLGTFAGSVCGGIATDEGREKRVGIATATTHEVCHAVRNHTAADRAVGNVCLKTSLPCGAFLPCGVAGSKEHLLSTP